MSARPPEATRPAPDSLHQSAEAPPTIQELVRHEPWLRRLALQIVHDPHTADDLVQETWVAAMMGPPVRSPRSWLKRVLFNRARSHWQRESLRGDSEYRAGRPDVDDSHLEQLARRDLRHSLSLAVMDLPEPYRSTLLDHYLRETPSAQIAQHAGVPESTVRWRLMRGREQLRERLDRDIEGGRQVWLSGLVAWIDGDLGQRTVIGGVSLSGVLGALAAAILVVVGGIALHSWNRARGMEVHGRSLQAVPALVRGVDSRRALLEAQAPIGEVTPERPSEVRVAAVAVDDFATIPEGSATDAIETNTESVTLLAVQVFDEASRTPLAGAAIYVLEPEGLVQRTQTDDSGRAQVLFESSDFHGGGFPRLENMASLRVHLSGRPWSTLHSFSREALSEWSEAGQLSLPLPRECEAIEGRVVDEEGVAIAGAEVTVGVSDGLPQFSPHEGFFTTLSPLRTFSDAGGAFRFEGVWPRPLEVRARVNGRPDAVLRARHDELSATEVVLQVARGASVHGSIRDRLGAPIPGARVWFDPPGFESPLRNQAEPSFVPRLVGFAASTVADTEGRFELSGLPLGKLRLWAQHPTSPALVAMHSIESTSPEAHEWSPALEEREALRVHVRLEEGASLPNKPVIHLASAKQGDLSWQRMLSVPADGVIELFDWPDILLDLYVQVELLAEAPQCDARHFRAQDSPIEVWVRRQERSRVRGRLVDHRGEFGTVAVLVISDRAKDFIASARIDPATGVFDFQPGPALYEVHVEVVGRGILSLDSVDLRADEVTTLAIELPEPAHLIPFGEPDDGDGDLHYRIHAHSAFGTRRDARVLVAEGRGAPREPIEVLPGLYSYILERDNQIIGGTLIPVTAGGEGPFDVRLGTDPIVPIRVVAAFGSAPLGTTLSVIGDEGDDPVHLELGDAERTSEGLWHVQLPRGAYHLEAALPDGTFLLRAVEIDAFGVRGELLVSDAE